MSEKVFTKSQILERLNARASIDVQVEQGVSFARDLADDLLRDGWKTYDTFSYCKKALFEAHLEKEGRRVEIISSHFMGEFTLIRSFR